MKRTLIQIIAAIMAVGFYGCGQPEFRTEIETIPAGIEYEYRFNGEPIGIARGDTIITMPDDISCVAAELMEPGTIYLTMRMSRTWDNAILYGSDRCVNAAQSDSVGYIVTVCKSGSDCGD